MADTKRRSAAMGLGPDDPEPLEPKNPVAGWTAAHDGGPDSGEYPPPAIGGELDAAPVEITEAEVRQVLALAGEGLNLALPGRGYGLPDAWRFTDRDLDELTPPLTRIVNRHPRLAAAVARSDTDALMVAWTAGRYAYRNFSEVRDARADAEAEAGPSSLAGSHPGFEGTQ